MVFLAARRRLVRAGWPILLPLVAFAATAVGQVIEFDSNGLHYQALLGAGSPLPLPNCRRISPDITPFR